MGGLDVDRRRLSCVRTTVQIVLGGDVRMHEAKAGRPGDDADPARSPGRHVRRPFFGRTIHIARKRLAMPVNLFGRVGVVEEVDGRAPPLPQPNDRTRERVVVERGRHDVVGRQVD
jgi:hypothetical protein